MLDILLDSFDSMLIFRTMLSLYHRANHDRLNDIGCKLFSKDFQKEYRIPSFSAASQLVRPYEKYTLLKPYLETNSVPSMQFRFNLTEKLRFFAKDRKRKTINFFKAFFWHAFTDGCMLAFD